MRSLWITALWGLQTTCAYSTNFPLVHRDNPSVLHASLEQQRETSDLQKRDGPVQAPLAWYRGVVINITMGTPPQLMSLPVDIADHHFSLVNWYNPQVSTTYQGDYWYQSANDTMGIGSTQIKEFNFDSYYPEAVIGIGPGNHSLPYSLVDYGVIKSPSFSIWCDDLQTGEGSILFGGVNSAKYHGPLQAFSFDPASSLSIPLKEITIQLGANGSAVPGNSSTSKTFSMPDKPLRLQTFTEYREAMGFSFLPADIANQTYSYFNISGPDSDPMQQNYLGSLPCNRTDTENYTVSLTFGNITVSYPWEELIIPIRRVFDSGAVEDVCYFAIGRGKETSDYDYGYYIPGGPGAVLDYAGILGTVLMSRLYIAVDYDNNLIGVAPLNENPGPDNILEIGTGTELPDAVGDFPATNTPYIAPSVNSSTSSGLAALRTAPPSAQKHVVAALGAAALFAGL
ncbi:uncharacterized protein TRUGW13939_04841 [Talaromyces rugulosus]|uniref:Peptidase A1 domain-containing protein n=1 Tax=Talaromyces rugulosus TaxID=121627 RepID=A0A7H8QUN1_TALRU|nr:uncharacterized protein TRUGW13939_04841 [Talaromyces rugulosus]QKX57722.1 hypothetical protein TRUGW13939_04841 [Talaromyces rugulosus]